MKYFLQCLRILDRNTGKFDPLCTFITVGLFVLTTFTVLNLIRVGAFHLPIWP